uniref:Uncharacterized protein n=1 Tax=Anguilla anguilla TaxID=7936 RepID=A0A0E9SS58_ANGAN
MLTSVEYQYINTLAI